MVLTHPTNERQAIRHANEASYFTIEIYFDYCLGQHGSIPQLVRLETIHCTLSEAQERMREMAANWRERNPKSGTSLYGSIYNTSRAAEDWLNAVLSNELPHEVSPVHEFIDL